MSSLCLFSIVVCERRYLADALSRTEEDWTADNNNDDSYEIGNHLENGETMRRQRY